MDTTSSNDIVLDQCPIPTCSFLIHSLTSTHSLLTYILFVSAILVLTGIFSKRRSRVHSSWRFVRPPRPFRSRYFQEMKSTTQATRTELEMPSQMDTSIEKQRACLVEIAQSFHSICGDAVRGNYEHIFFQGCEVERRLCSDIMNKHYAFAKALRDNGSTWKLVEVAREGQPSNYRTRQQAIIDAAALQKRSRGQEV